MNSINAKSFIDFFNPLRYVDSKTYASFWEMLFATFLNGFWSRFFAVLLIIFSFWFWINRRNVAVGIVCLVGSLLFAYGSFIVSLFS